jgi:DNA-binding MarR family transcriptional regulator
MEDKQAFVQRFMQNLYRIARCRKAMFQDALEKYGVTLHQFHLMLHIRSAGKMKVTELSEKMLVSMPTASRMINSLCDLGLVSKQKATGDRRSTYLELTRKGEEILEEIRGLQLEMITKLIEAVPDKKMEVFIEVTESLADNWMAVVKNQASNRCGITDADGSCS